MLYNIILFWVFLIWSGSREDIPVGPDGNDMSKGGYSYYFVGLSHKKLVNSYGSNAKFESMEDHQTMSDYESKYKVIKLHKLCETSVMLPSYHMLRLFCNVL